MKMKEQHIWFTTDFVTKAILELLTSGYVINPLTVAAQNDSKRLVVDLSVDKKHTSKVLM